VTVADHPNGDLAPDTWHSIRKQAGLKEDADRRRGTIW
jgi:predicted RNA binding protein YcfA (HicA-like mRNA interferase family)